MLVPVIPICYNENARVGYMPYCSLNPGVVAPGLSLYVLLLLCDHPQVLDRRAGELGGNRCEFTKHIHRQSD